MTMRQGEERITPQFAVRRQNRPTEQLAAELELARAEIARLRADQQRITDAERASSRVEELVAALEGFSEDGDEVWQERAATLRLKNVLLELCDEVEKAMRAIRHELTEQTPLVEIDRRRRTDDADVDTHARLEVLRAARAEA
jgi:23S rRNA C2498 (ribose-2'-O)-methylase RlmM